MTNRRWETLKRVRGSPGMWVRHPGHRRLPCAVTLLCSHGRHRPPGLQVQNSAWGERPEARASPGGRGRRVSEPTAAAHTATHCSAGPAGLRPPSTVRAGVGGETRPGLRASGVQVSSPPHWGGGALSRWRRESPAHVAETFVSLRGRSPSVARPLSASRLGTSHSGSSHPCQLHIEGHRHRSLDTPIC